MANAYKTIHTKGYPKVLRTLNRVMRTPHAEDNQAVTINEPKPLSNEEIRELRSRGLTSEIKNGYVVR